MIDEEQNQVAQNSEQYSDQPKQAGLVNAPPMPTPPQQLPLANVSGSKKISKIVLISSIIIVILVSIAGGYYFFLRPDKPVDKKPVESIFKDEEKNVTELEGGQEIVSELGFTVKYNADIFWPSGQVTIPTSDKGKIIYEGFEDSNTTKPRAYSIVTLSMKQKYDETQPEMYVSTNIRTDYFERKYSEAAFKGMNNYQIMYEVIIGSKLAADPQCEASPTNRVTINSFEYDKVILSCGSGETHDNVNDDVFYLTVQNDRPYWIRLVANKNGKLYGDAMKEMETVLGMVSYQEPDRTLFAN